MDLSKIKSSHVLKIEIFEYGKRQMDALLRNMIYQALLQRILPA